MRQTQLPGFNQVTGQARADLLKDVSELHDALVAYLAEATVTPLTGGPEVVTLQRLEEHALRLDAIIQKSGQRVKRGRSGRSPNK